MSRRRRNSSPVWTSTDSLLLDVEQVEKWALIAVHDGDGSTSALASIVTRLRSVADTIADYLFRTSEPVRGRPRTRTRSARPNATRRASAPAPEEKQGRTADSPKPPEGRA